MPSPAKNLSLADSVLLIVGIIIGTGIYETSSAIAGLVGDQYWLWSIWFMGALLSLFGAFCYAELASAYPEEGGDYQYLSRAYGRWAGFLFAWANLTIIRPGSIAAMAFSFSRYFASLFPAAGGAEHSPSFIAATAAIAVVFLTMSNMLGIRRAIFTQRVLTAAKMLGLAAIFGAALFCDSGTAAVSAPTAGERDLGLALILVLFCYGGWNEITYVAAEVVNPSRNLLRSMVFGIGVVFLLYLLVSIGFVEVLGYGNVVSSKAVAADTLERLFPSFGARAMAVLICLSALGATSGLIFSGSRILYAMASDLRFLPSLASWNDNRGGPYYALTLQALISILFIALAGSFMGVLVYTTAVVWLFFLLTGLSVFILRRAEPDVPRPYKVTAHPYTTSVFCASAAYLLYSALLYDPRGSIAALSVVLLGIPLYRWAGRRELLIVDPGKH